MDENTWKIFQILMWVIGLQTTVLVVVLGCIWKSVLSLNARFDKIDQRFQKIDDKLEVIHGKICHLEGASEKQIYVLKEENQVRKAK